MVEVQAIRRYCSICSAVFRSDIDRCPRDGGEIQERLDNPVLGLILGDRYRVVEQLGVGGMGEVYRVQHTTIDKPFAAKIMLGEMAANKLAVARFQREAKALSRLSHANIVSVTDFGTTKMGLLYLITEYIDGTLLSDEIMDGPLQPRRAIWLVRQIALALSHAHKRGLVHRDLKASNVMLTCDEDDSESVKVLDFGIAIMVDGPPKPESMDMHNQLTTQGMVMGTPTHMSPEQARGEKLDGRSDLYTLGVMFHQMLTGTPPFVGDSAIEILSQHLKSPPPRIEREDVSEELGDIIVKLLAKERDDRYEDARDLIEALDSLPSDRVSSSGIRVLKSVMPGKGNPLASPILSEDSLATIESIVRADSQPNVAVSAGMITPASMEALVSAGVPESLPRQDTAPVVAPAKKERNWLLPAAIVVAAIIAAVVFLVTRDNPNKAASAGTVPVPAGELSGSNADVKPGTGPAAGPGGDATGGATEKPGIQPADQPVDKPADKPADQPVDKPADKPADQPVDKPADKPIDKPADQPIDKPADKPIDKSGSSQQDRKKRGPPSVAKLKRRLTRVGKKLDALGKKTDVNDLRMRYFDLGMEMANVSGQPAARKAFDKKLRSLESAIRKRGK